MGKTTTFTIVPDRSLIRKLGARSRAFPMVVTELVDNSLDSWTEIPQSKRKKGLVVEISAEGKSARNPYFIIKDNAGGMTAEVLAKALKVAHSIKTGDPKFLGEYGFGLKSACMYIGPEFEIFTRSFREPDLVHYLLFDHKKFEKDTSDSWEIEVKTMSVKDAGKAEVYFPDGHGTEIRIKNEKYVSANREGIEKRLSRIFGPRLPKKGNAPKLGRGGIKYEEMTIKFNNDAIYASGPFYTPYEPPTKDDKASKSGDKDHGLQNEPALVPRYLNQLVTINSKSIKGRKVSGIAGIIDRGMGHNNKYGFDLIKNGRVIEMNVTDGEKENAVGLSRLNHNARIVGQLFLDDEHWQTDHQKTEFLRDGQNDVWQGVAEYVESNIKSLIKISRNLQEPQLQEIEKRESESDQIVRKAVEEALPDISNEIQKSARSGELKSLLNKIDLEVKTGPNPKKLNQKTSNTSLVYAKPIIGSEYNGRTAALYRLSSRKSDSNILLTVKVNFDHPFLKKWESGERKAIAGFIGADAMAEYILKEKGLDTIEQFNRIRDTILRGMKGK